jgi:hypothetical protein
MQKTMRGTMQIVIEHLSYVDGSIRIRINLINHKGKVLWTTYQTGYIGDSINLMGATFDLEVMGES